MFENKTTNPHYDATCSDWIYMDATARILPCKPLNPFTSYSDDFDVLKHSDGKIKLIGHKYSVFKNANTKWNWACVERTTSKQSIIESSLNTGYQLEISGSLSEFDFNNIPNL